MELYEKRHKWVRPKQKQDSKPVEGEIVDELPDNLKDAQDKKEQEAYQNQYALAKTYQNAITVIANDNPTDVTPQKQAEILALVDEWQQVAKQYQQEDGRQLPLEVIGKYTTFTDTTNKNIETLKDNLNKLLRKNVKRPAKQNNQPREKVTAQKIFSVTDETFKLFDNILNAKLPKSILAAVALSNPLTAIVYENRDLLTGLTSGTYNAVKNTSMKIEQINNNFAKGRSK